MKYCFLVLAIIGALVPYAFFIPFFAEHGFGVTTFTGALFVNGAASGFTADLLITSFAFWMFILIEKTRRPWLYILINLSIGLSCALPLYLYFRLAERGINSSRQTA